MPTTVYLHEPTSNIRMTVVDWRDIKQVKAMLYRFIDLFLLCVCE